MSAVKAVLPGTWLAQLIAVEDTVLPIKGGEDSRHFATANRFSSTSTRCIDGKISGAMTFMYSIPIDARMPSVLRC